METNVQLEMAFDFVQYTNKNIFLTGKAGTGKTTFLHNLKKSTPKRMAIVAPTGVAAINAGGVTIHSFFQMPFTPFVPKGVGLHSGNEPHRKFHKEKINLIRSLDLLVIDEISMVRADTLDGIDDVLRRYKDHSLPFGGVQLLMIGDLHQLSPVVKDDDWKILKDFYSNIFFFNSKALQQTQPISIELKHIYRQSDSRFIDLLNSVRENKITEAVLNQLNQRHIPNFKPADDEGYITLTTHNNAAQRINDVRLSEINRPVYKFKAVVKDDFPEFSYPVIAELELKIGSQVMFVKNDGSRERLFYNGKIGKVTNINDGVIYVKCPGDTFEIVAEPVEWQNIKFELNSDTKEIEERVIGTFTQYPLKLAWAITIHKSQGLTFEKAIIDANAAFAHGQVYVALSRCKSFEGMVLSTPIATNSVKTDGTVAAYTKNANDNSPTEEQLNKSKVDFQLSLLYDLFDFNEIKTRLFYCNKLVEDHNNILPDELISNLTDLKFRAETEIYKVADSFKKQLGGLTNSSNLPEDDLVMKERITKGCTYFVEKIESILYYPVISFNLSTDNKSVQTSVNEYFENYLKECFIKLSLMKLCIEGFKTLNYLQSKANLEIDYVNILKSKKAQVNININVPNLQLYGTIKKWRDDLASEKNSPVYIILPQKSLVELVTILPSTIAELESIKGIGKAKSKQYGRDLLVLIADYCAKQGIKRNPMQINLKPEKVKSDTKLVSFDLFKSGKSVMEIAQERGYTIGTIEGHLAHFIITGEISVFDVVSKIKVAKIMAFLIQNPTLSTNDAKSALGDEVIYNDLRAVMNHLRLINSDKK
ncbi:MAG: AAA family ATPase [Burkholderiales bacterium]|nr:AAA family ATPase [Bacteroidia bacterium]